MHTHIIICSFYYNSAGVFGQLCCSNVLTGREVKRREGEVGVTNNNKMAKASCPKRVCVAQEGKVHFRNVRRHQHFHQRTDWKFR